MKFKILVFGSNDEKKHALEQNVIWAYEQIGWSVDQNRIGISAEYDVYCIFKYNPSIKCIIECKAIKQDKRTSMNDLRIFNQKLKELNQMGIFISLGGFVANAKNNVNSEFKDEYTNLSLMDYDDYYKFLLEHEFIVDYSTILEEYNIHPNSTTSINLILNKEIMYWLIIIEDYYIFRSATCRNLSSQDYSYLHDKMKIVKDNIEKEIIENKTELKKIDYTDIIISIAEKEQDITELSKNIKQKEETCLFYLNDLVKKEIFSEIQGKYYLQNQNIGIMKKTFNFLSNSKKLVYFLSSKYYREYINNNYRQIAKSIGYDEIDELKKYLLISPTISTKIHKDQIDMHNQIETKRGYLAIQLIKDLSEKNIAKYNEKNMMYIYKSPEIHIVTPYEILFQILPAAHLFVAYGLFKIKTDKSIQKLAPLGAKDDLILRDVGLCFLNAGLENQAKNFL